MNNSKKRFLGFNGANLNKPILHNISICFSNIKICLILHHAIRNVTLKQEK